MCFRGARIIFTTPESPRGSSLCRSPRRGTDCDARNIFRRSYETFFPTVFTRWRARVPGQESQSDNADSSEGLRARAVKMLETQVDPLRRKIQLAIDAEYPYYDLDHRSARKEFDLPPARPFS